MAEWVKKWQVTKESTGKKYIVSVADDSTWGCSCPVWTFKRQICKHINMVTVSRGTRGQARRAGYGVEHIFSKKGWVGTIFNPEPLGTAQPTGEKAPQAAKEQHKPSIPIKPIKPPAPNPPTVLEVLKKRALYREVV